MHDDATIARIKRRDGVIGLILAQHQINDGVRKKETKTLAESLEVLRRHIDKIAELTGSHRHVALGTDLDGFIKPTIGGVDTMADLKNLEAAIRTAYPQDADLLLWDNSLRVLRKAWAPSP
jgi:microsomal dipeptidase-like Zn-dependent dipeptidase